MTHFVPIMTHFTTRKTARLFCDHVYKLYGLTKVILSNKDVRLTSRDWNALHGLSRIRFDYVHHISSSKCVIGDMLLHYANPL